MVEVFKYREIQALFTARLPDSADSDQLPDRVPLNGYGTLRPNIRGASVVFTEVGEFAVPRTRQVAFVDGELMVEVVDGESSILQPLFLEVTVDERANQEWSWTLTFDSLTVGEWGEEISHPALSFPVEEGDGPLELSTVATTVTRTANFITRGPAGTGVEGVAQAGKNRIAFVLSDGSLTNTIDLPVAEIDESVVVGMISDPVVVEAAGLVTYESGEQVYAAAGVPENVLAQQARSSKGGGIGVGNRGALAIRFDDWHNDFKEKAYPIMTRLGLPAGFATISRLDDQSWSRGITPEDIRRWNHNGIEFHSHGTDHKDPSPGGDAGLVDQIVNSKAEIEEWGVKVQGWMHPGATPLTDQTPYGAGFGDPAHLYTTRAGALIRATYPVSESYCQGVVRSLPFGMLHGNDHTTVSDGVSFAAAMESVDLTIQDKVGREIMIHCGNIGSPGSITWEQFEALMEHIAASRRDGLLEVVTPSGLVFADKTDKRLNLLEENPFDSMGTDQPLPAKWNGTWTGKSIVEGAGPDGQNVLRFEDSEAGFISRRLIGLSTMGLDGETFVITGLVRSTVASDSVVSRILVQDYDDNSRLNLSLTRNQIREWTRVYHAVTLPPGTSRVLIGISRNSGSGIEWADLRVDKV